MNYSYKLVMLKKLVKSLGTVVITFIVYVFGSLNTFADMYFGWNIVFFVKNCLILYNILIFGVYLCWPKFKEGQCKGKGSVLIKNSSS